MITEETLSETVEKGILKKVPKTGSFLGDKKIYEKMTEEGWHLRLEDEEYFVFKKAD